jgi:hypothetical protein
MIGWWLTLFGLSVLTFVDTFFAVGSSLREMTSVALLLSLLGLMTRISRKTRKGEREELVAQIAQLERDVQAAQQKHIQQVVGKPVTEKFPTTV